MIINNVDYFNKVPKKGRILSLDVGTKKIGVAICDDTQIIATPKLILKRHSNQRDFSELLSIIQENHIVAVVIGYPTKMDGTASDITNFVEKFVENFAKFLQEKNVTNIFLVLFDERLSSFEARSYINKNPHTKKDYDDISASLILENFINSAR